MSADNAKHVKPVWRVEFSLFIDDNWAPTFGLTAQLAMKISEDGDGWYASGVDSFNGCRRMTFGESTVTAALEFVKDCIEGNKDTVTE